MTTATDIGAGLLHVREAHRFCVSNPIYPHAHGFLDCPVLAEFRRLVGYGAEPESADPLTAAKAERERTLA